MVPVKTSLLTFGLCPLRALFKITIPESLQKKFNITSFQRLKWPQNKNALNFQHYFQAQFFILFHMIWSILFGVLALKTLKWKYLIGCLRISTNDKVVFQANTPNKIDNTKWGSILKLCPKMVSKVVCIFVWGHLNFWKDV